MTRATWAGLAILAALPALAHPAFASPTVSAHSARPQVYNGFLKKLFRPKIDLGKGVRALTYPVKKAAVNGGKAAVGAAASYYMSSKKPGIPQILPKK